MSTPMLAQYREIKDQHRDAILFFRLGDFYEMFGQDARDASRLLGLTLTQRQGMPMCGVPHHAAQTYVGRLLRSGRKVAVCEQRGTSDGKSITHREVVEVLSPGTVFDADFLDPEDNNHLVALGSTGNHCCVGWCDASTGELTLAAYPFTSREERDGILQRELARLAPRETLVQESLLEESPVLQKSRGTVTNRIPDWGFDTARGERRLREILGVASLQGFGFAPGDPELYTAATLLEYLEDNAHHVLNHIHQVKRHHDDHVLILDEATLRNLELIRNMHDGGRGYTLLEVLDETVTPMGSRLLRRRITAPPRDSATIDKRLATVDALYHNQQSLQEVRSILQGCHDLERLAGRLGVEKAHPRDLWGIANTLEAAGRLIPLLSALPDLPDLPEMETLLPDGSPQWRACVALGERIHAVLVEEPPVTLADGGVIRPGVDTELDHHRDLHTNSRRILDGYLEEQRNETGITTLKIRYNRVLGHFFEVPRSHESRVPEHYIRRQSLANADRFTTPRLSTLETELQGAAAAAIEREQELFLQLRHEAAHQTATLLTLAAGLAAMDVAATLARVATVRGYRRPVMRHPPGLRIRDGRHPVVEAHLPPGDFVANDLDIGGDHGTFALITGPNMAGKSTVLRQTALITLMAHMGSFVPAAEAEIGLVDRIYCRVGASDNIARGESTFLVEMSETSNILRTATSASLVIMDEVGRGTSTHDGLSIAWAVSEYLLDHVGCPTLFATHYHELSGLAHPACRFLTMEVAHSAEQIVFLKKLSAGRADRSYGVDVARLAGLPEKVIARARVLLAQLETQVPLTPGSTGNTGTPEGESHEELHGRTNGKNQRDELFSPADLLAAEIRSIDPDTLSPRDALDLIYRWRREL